jgi:hypothetical protein
MGTEPQINRELGCNLNTENFSSLPDILHTVSLTDLENMF